MKRIVLTGGGTAGHVMPNIALLPYLIKEGWDVHYIGSHTGIERSIVEGHNVPYHPISSGKLRRYANIKNLSDPFRVVKGIGDAAVTLGKLKPQIIFSKGGFVAVPVILAGATLGIKSIIHESDMTPGLANKISIPFARVICATFPETMNYLPSKKAVLTGAPIRDILLSGDRRAAAQLCNISDNKPVVLIMGGSSGSVKINLAVREALPSLLNSFNVVHLCGIGKTDDSYNCSGYKQFEFISEELRNILALADVVISRAGSNSITELLALKKPNLLIPLSANASRGDQILNARSFEKQGFSLVLEEESMTSSQIHTQVQKLYNNRSQYIAAMSKSQESNGVERIMEIINKLSSSSSRK